MTLPAMAVLLIVMLITHEPLTWRWILLPVALGIQTGILAGLVLMGARLVNVARDIGNLIPVMIRLLRYISGVFFSIDRYAEHHPTVQACLSLQPLALPMDLVRQCLMAEFPVKPLEWFVGLGWAVVLLGAGLWIFWRDEANYGRA